MGPEHNSELGLGIGCDEKQENGGGNCTDVDEEDGTEEKHLQEQLSKVLGALESRFEERSKYTTGNEELEEEGLHQTLSKDDAESGLVIDSLDVSVSLHYLLYILMLFKMTFFNVFCAF